MLPVTVTILPPTSLNCSMLSGRLKYLDMPSVDPVSKSMYSLSSSVRLLSISLALSRMSRLNEGFVLDQAGKAAWAASTASIACFLETAEPFQITLLVTGETTSKVVSLVISLPLIISGTTWSTEGLEACVPLV